MNIIHIRLAGRSKERKTIGFFGVDSGVGTTHLAIAAANYAVNEWGVSAAVVELGNHLCISDLDMEAGERDFFTIDGVGYYPHVMPARMPELLNAAFQYLILDLGCEEDSWQEFLRCDLKYVVASFSPWRIRRAEDFITLHTNDNTLNYFTALLTVTGSVYEKKKFQRKYHVPVRTIPFIADPFWLVKDQLPFFQELL